MSVLHTVRLQPGSHRGPLVETTAVALLVPVTERAAEDLANGALVLAPAAHLGVAPSRVRIARGHTARIEIDE